MKIGFRFNGPKKSTKNEVKQNIAAKSSPKTMLHFNFLLILIKVRIKTIVNDITPIILVTCK